MNNNKGISGFDAPLGQEPRRNRRNRLLLIGIDRYWYLPTLQHPVGDCQQLFVLLQEHYGFENQDLISALYDTAATRQVLYDELFRLKGDDHEGTPLLSGADNLVLVFSGHGYLDERDGKGYWAPVDAPALDTAADLGKTLISVEHLVETLSKVRAHHILLIVDACFAGAFAHMELEVPPSGDWNTPEEKPSRWALTAGRNQVVADKSPFAEALQQVLRDNTELRISIKWVGSEIERRVGRNGRQLPWCGAIVRKEYEGGEFFFHRQTPAPQVAVAPWQTITIEELPQRLRHGSRAHLTRLKKGRFQFLHIEKLLLAGLATPGFLETSVKAGGEATPLLQALQPLWLMEKHHAVVLGEGGMGKTVSLVRLWEDMLHAPSTGIPVFVALNEYNAAPDTEKSDFVLHYIARQCLGIEALTEEWRNALWQVLQSPLPSGAPSTLLLLDGFNEITVEKTGLLLELNKIAEQAAGVQLVVTSRYVEIQNFTWAQGSEILELLPLEPVQIADYLHQNGLSQPENPELLKLFGNPMMLTLYAGSSSIGLRYRDDGRFRWLPVSTQGELLWNFHEAQLARFLEDVPQDTQEQAWLSFLLRHLLPYLAFRMEKEGQFFIHTRRSDNPTFNIKSVLEDAYREWNNENFTDTFPLFEGKRRSLGFGIAPDDLDGVQARYVRIRQYLVEKLHVLVAEDEVLRFVHQNFRDFLAACHLRQAAELALRQGEMPEEWKERAFPVYLRRMLGEVEGEQYIKPVLDKEYDGYSLPLFENLVSRLLERCRDRFPSQRRDPWWKCIRKALLTYWFNTKINSLAPNLIIWNIWNISVISRTNLAGANFSNLDLRNIVLNGIPFSIHWKQKYLATNFKGSLISKDLLFFKGHVDRVICAVYSPDGKKILSGCWGGHINEWSVDSGGCIHQYFRSDAPEGTLIYSPDGKKILSASRIGITEWSVNKGDKPRRFGKNYYNVVKVMYNLNGKKIISINRDTYGKNSIKEWSTISKICTKKYNKCEIGFEGFAISPKSQKIFSFHWNGLIKQWCIKTGKCIKTYDTQTNLIKSVVISPDEKKMLFTSDDKIIKEWSIESGECLNKFQGHTDIVNSIAYSPDGKKILSASDDKTIREWSIETRECIQIIRGHFDKVNTIAYSPDEKKILSASDDRTIREWSVETGECLQVISHQHFGDLTRKYPSEINSELFSKASKIFLKMSYVSHEYGFYHKDQHSAIKSAIYNQNDRVILLASWDGTVKECSVNKKICTCINIGHNDKVMNAMYNVNNSKIISSSIDGKIIEWSAYSGLSTRIFEINSILLSTTYNSDNKKILTSLEDGTIKEWSADTGNLLCTYLGHTDWVFCAVYSPDEKKILSTSKDGTIKEWSVQNKECIRTYIGHNKWVYNAVYSSDGKKIISASKDGKVKEWSVVTGKCLRTFKDLNSEVNSVVYSADNKKILVTLNNHIDDSSILFNDRKIVEISAKDGKVIKSFNFKFEEPLNAVYDKTGEKILCCFRGGIVRELSVKSGDCLNIFKNEIGLFLQSVDFRHLHPDSHFTDEEKDRLRRYGAIFDDEDERLWKEAIADAYGDGENQ